MLYTTRRAKTKMMFHSLFFSLDEALLSVALGIHNFKICMIFKMELVSDK